MKIDQIIKEDAEPMDREFALVKKLGRLGERIVQNPRLWDRYDDAIDNDNTDWIIGLIQDGTGATADEVSKLADLFGEIGGGLGRIIDFAWAVKEGTWNKDFMDPYRAHRSQDLNEFAPAGGGSNRMGGGGRRTGGNGGDDGGGEDPYKYPQPQHYSRSIDFFGRFEADHFDDEEFDDATGVFKGYWDDAEGRDQIAYFKFDNPQRTGDDDPGMGWYYEPQNESVAEGPDDSDDYHSLPQPYGDREEEGYMAQDTGFDVDDEAEDQHGLNEFAPGGDSASSYYAVTANFVNEFAQQKQEELQDLIDAGWTEQDLAQAGTLKGQAADIAHFERVRDRFLKGLKPGFDAYLRGDTQMKDQLGAYWMENDLPLNRDWESIYGEPWGDDSEFNEGVAEGTGNIGPAIKSLYQKIYNAGDDEIDYFYHASPIFAQYWDEYEGDLDSIIAEVDPSELEVIKAELESYVDDANLAEGAENPYGYEVGQQVELAGGQQGQVTDIFDGTIEVLLPDGRTAVVDFQDAQVLDEGKPREKEADYGPEYQDMVARVKKLAGLGPLKTVYDPQKRVYKNVPRAVQPGEKK